MMNHTRIIPIIFLIISFLGISTCQRSGSSVLDEVPLVDGHNDLPWSLHIINDNRLKDYNMTEGFHKTNCRHCRTDLEKLRLGKVGGQFWSAFVSCDIQYKDPVVQTLEQIDVIYRLIKKNSNALKYVSTANGIMEAFKEGKIASMIGVEGGHSIASSLAVLRMMYRLGVRYMTLTHDCSTPWAEASTADDAVLHKGAGLSRFGEVVIKEMNRLGMLVDLSHVSHSTMVAALKVTRAPVIFSHAAAYTVLPHRRNVRDDILLKLKTNGGIIMVNFYSAVIAKANATIDDVITHINYIADLIGPDFIGIGGDFDGVTEFPEGLEDVSRYVNLFDRLQESNPEQWTTQNLKKLASLNLMRVWRKAEEVRDALEQDEEPYEEIISRKFLTSQHLACQSRYL